MNPRLRSAPIELRASTEEDAPEGILEGYASVYDVEYRIGYALNEEIAPAAFDASLAARDYVVPIFYQHDWSNPIGYADVTSDARGVRVRACLFIDSNPLARSVWMAAKAGALREWSVGFVPNAIEIRSEDGVEIERITEGDLCEASVVVRGANPDAEMLSVRSETSASEADADEAADAPAEVELPAWIADNIESPLAREIVRELLG